MKKYIFYIIVVLIIEYFFWAFILFDFNIIDKIDTFTLLLSVIYGFIIAGEFYMAKNIDSEKEKKDNYE